MIGRGLGVKMKSIKYIIVCKCLPSMPYWFVIVMVKFLITVFETVSILQKKRKGNEICNLLMISSYHLILSSHLISSHLISSHLISSFRDLTFDLTPVCPYVYWSFCQPAHPGIVPYIQKSDKPGTLANDASLGKESQRKWADKIIHSRKDIKMSI